MGLVGQDRGELHTRNRGISRRVTIQWSSHKSGGRPPLTGCEVQQALWFSAGGPTMTRDNGVRTVFTRCTSAAGDTRPIQPSEALKQCHDGRVAPGSLSPRESATHLLEYKAADEVRSARSSTPISRLQQVTAVVGERFQWVCCRAPHLRNNPDQPFNPD